MLKLLKDLIKEEDGMGTVEIVIIIAVLVGIALIFRTQIVAFVNSTLAKIFGRADVNNLDSIGSGT